MVQTKKRLLYFCLFFLLYEMAVYLSNDMIMPAMPQVVREFHSSSHAIGLSLSLYILGGSTLQIFLGPVADRIGKRKVMLAGNALFLAATLLVPFAQTITQFLAIRFSQGMGSCFIFIGYAAVHELLDDERAVKMTSLMGNTTVFAPLIGPVIGSAVITVMDWRAVFGIAFALGAVAWVGLFRTMPGPAAAPSAGAPSAVQVSPAARPGLAASYRAIFTNRTFMFGIFTAACAIAPLTAWIGLSPAIVLQRMGASYGTYIAWQCAIFCGFVCSTLAIQRLGEGFSLVRLLRQGGALALAGMAGAALLHRQGHLFVLCMFVYSAGFGLFNGALIRIALTSTGISMSLTSSAMSLLYCLYLAGGLELYNAVCARFDYALGAYALMNAPLGVFLFLALRRIAGRAASSAPSAPSALPVADTA
ncbi:multidrug transporter [Massilia sp. Root418]|uniref:MFS transporter n=1 Tax=Massilia sp. Root418 TaxID=1736532 RepID=UPI0006F46EB2|nr:MFS transporter [Massilia sp. Root418]KQX02036.1 multidrug transporter [Massilia sp. Root418]